MPEPQWLAVKEVTKKAMAIDSTDHDPRVGDPQELPVEQHFIIATNTVRRRRNCSAGPIDDTISCSCFLGIGSCHLADNIVADLLRNIAGLVAGFG